MKKISRISVLLLTFTTVLFLGCEEKSKEIVKSKFTGLWTLYAMEKQDSITGEWSQWRDGMQGYILYDDTENMSIHLTTKGYQNTDLEFDNFSEDISLDALKYLTNSYVYFAKYSLDEEEQIVQHARISHSNPQMWNQVVKRRYSFSGDTLTLQPVEKSISGLRVRWLKDNRSNKK